MDLNDRGTKKWTSLMIPEHVDMIKKVWREDEREEKRILDELQVEEITFALQRAHGDGLPVEIKHHNGFNYSRIKVKIHELDPQTKKIRCVDFNKGHLIIKFDDIFDVKFY